MSAIKQFVDRLNRRLFQSVTTNKLVYNTCWEDPRIDRQLLGLDNSSRVLMLTSAGDNALAYLLDNPTRIDTVDINPVQNALLELKSALFHTSDYRLLWQMFGEGAFTGTTACYHRSLQGKLSPTARDFWDNHLDYFSPSATGGSLYYRGTAGAFARLACRRLKYKGVYQSVMKLLNARSLAEQRYWFDEIEPRLWNAFIRWLMQQEATLALLGVPKTQRAIIDNEAQGGLTGFIRRSLKNVFTKRSIADNYFWRVYLTGSYTPDCAPAYLKEKHFGKLQRRLGRLHHHTASLSSFLKQQEKTYTHFVLLDHQDWLAHYQPRTLAEEWQLMLEHAQPGSRILFRSAGTTRSFVPDFVDNHVHYKDKKTEKLRARDRVGTYGGTHLAIVDQPL